MRFGFPAARSSLCVGLAMLGEPRQTETAALQPVAEMRNMLRAFKWPFLITGLIALAACDPAFPSLAGGDELRKAEVTVDRPFEQVFDELAIVAVSNSYSIFEFDEENGLIELGFGIERDEENRLIPLGFGVPKSSFIQCQGPDWPPYWAEWGRGASLAGRMIIQVKAKSDVRTQVKLRAHYSYTSTLLALKFRTGEGGSMNRTDGAINLLGGAPSRGRSYTYSCRPTHLAERTILNGIQETDVFERLPPVQGLKFAHNLARAAHATPDLAELFLRRSRVIYASACARAVALENDALGLEHTATRLQQLGMCCWA